MTSPLTKRPDGGNMWPAQIVDAITKQNWKNGGVLVMDTPDAVELIRSAIETAKAHERERCAEWHDIEAKLAWECGDTKLHYAHTNSAAAIRKMES